MIIKRLQLENIRSYREASIEFPLGRTLFEGDVGSGKSTILMAIEFALFGLSSEREGGSLLRVGEDEGRASITFDVGGKDYVVSRSLVRKGNKLQQTRGSLRGPDGEEDFAATELKERILDILQFNEVPDPKAQSWIYRYAVYTPQEEMASILTRTADERVQILRRAFGSEDYKVAAENANEVAREIRHHADRLEERASDLQALKARIQKWNDELVGMKKDLARFMELEEKEEIALQALESEKDRLRDDELRLGSLIREIEYDEQLLKRKNNDVSEWLEEVGGLRKRIDAMMTRMGRFGESAESTEKTQEELAQRVREIRKKIEELQIMEDRIDTKLDEYRSIMKNGVCPVCDREATSREFAGREKQKQAEREHVAKDLEGFRSSLEQAEKDLQRRQRLDASQESVNELKQEVARCAQEIVKRNEKIANGEDELKKLNTRLTGAKIETQELASIGKRLEELGNRIKNTTENLQIIRERITQTKTRNEDYEENIAEGERQVSEKEEHSRRAGSLKESAIWLQDFFCPTLESIERHVMSSINQDFNANFQKWFAMLVQDPEKDARVDEDFTPLVSQDGYDQDVQYLSGGERTSVSMAYRLALNTLVQKVSIGMKSNLLILDEPTDGFSKEQLGNVREMLDEIDCPQLIVVSHEKELESLADQIFRVSKVRGESAVVAGVR